MSSSNANSLSGILSLLQKISQDQEKLHDEVASIREETERLARSNQKCMEKVLRNLDDSMTTVGRRIKDVESRFEGMEQTSPEPTRIARRDVEKLLDIDVSRASENKGEFIFFPRLPLELQLKIWEVACFNNPTVFKLHASMARILAPHPAHDEFKGWRFSGYRVPAVLLTCRESRKEALKWYKRVYFSFSDFSFGEGLYPKYVNINIDVLCPILDRDWRASFAGRHSSFPGRHSWIDIITSNPTIREFRRIVIPEYELPLSIWDHGTTWEDREKKRLIRSPIEEVIVVPEGCGPVDTDQRLVPARFHDEPPHSFNDYHGRIQDVNKGIEEFSATLEALASASKNCVDHYRRMASAGIVPKFTVMWFEKIPYAERTSAPEVIQMSSMQSGQSEPQDSFAVR